MQALPVLGELGAQEAEKSVVVAPRLHHLLSATLSLFLPIIMLLLAG